jgi:hypothetical protein
LGTDVGTGAIAHGTMKSMQAQNPCCEIPALPNPPPQGVPAGPAPGMPPVAPSGIDASKLCLPTDYFFHAMFPVWSTGLAPLAGQPPDAVQQCAAGILAVGWYWFNNNLPCCTNLLESGTRAQYSMAAGLKMAQIIGYDLNTILQARQVAESSMPQGGVCPVPAGSQALGGLAAPNGSARPNRPWWLSR